MDLLGVSSLVLCITAIIVCQGNEEAITAVTLEERQNRGLHTESSNYRGYAEFYKAGSPPRTQED